MALHPHCILQLFHRGGGLGGIFMRTRVSGAEWGGSDRPSGKCADILVNGQTGNCFQMATTTYLSLSLYLHLFLYIIRTDDRWPMMTIPILSHPLHYAARAAIWRKKNYHEMFNFENWFLCQFSSNTRYSFGGGSLNTPKIGKRKKEFTNMNLRGFKIKKTWRGCLSRINRVSKFSFLYMLWYLLS